MDPVQGSEENMYKSQLQELCHKKKWALPIYSAMKDGSEHNPQFKSSVLVNGTYFNTINICKSLKEAYNEAAKLAFFYFSPDGKSTGGGANVDDQTMKAGETDSQIQINHDGNESPYGGKMSEQAGVGANVKTSSFGDDTRQKFKLKLEIYAQRKNIGLPVYHSTREGPPNSLCFRTTVTVGSDSFKSPGIYKSIKQAEDAAAQFALMAFSTDAFQENDIRLYKNLLQEYALREGFFMPRYQTTRTGEAHDPTFNATVEVEGEIFHGNPAMSKKLAELSAAKVAYTNLMHRNEVLKLASCFNFLTHDEVRVSGISESRTPSRLLAKYGVPTEVTKGYLAGKSGFEMEAISVPADAAGKCFKIDDFSSSSSENAHKLTPGTSSCSIDISEMLKSRCPTVSTPTAMKDGKDEAVLDGSIPEMAKIKIKDKIPVSSCKDSSTMKMTTDIKCYLLNNRIRVYTYIPDVASTMGNVVLPVGEGKWVVGSLEFPK